jgi:hypothetical protein
MKANKEYRPPLWITIFLLVGSILVPSALFFMAGPKLTMTSLFLLSFSLMGIVAIVELKVSKVVICEDEVDIIGLFQRKTIPMKDIDHVELSDRQAAIRLKDGQWQRLPSWFSKHKSFFHTIRNRISREMP